ncbi:MAG: hypothetical protein HY647_09650 [Acidobacteria bacterium]|nr:hypothetical protein [Acidobacteriota bacterium]
MKASLFQNADVEVLRLARDRKSGSVELALRACRILELSGLKGSRPNVPAETVARCNRLARAVAQAQPSMAAVLNVSNRWLCAVQKGEPMAGAARRLAQELHCAQQAAAARAASLVRNGATVVTYSFSSTVLAALQQAWNRGRRFRVLCSESRPQMEGRTLAQRLAASRISVELYTDAALFSAVSEADLVLVGCDVIGSLGFVNKVGTLGLLNLARRWRISLYVVGDTFKLLPPGLTPWFRVRSEKPSEVWKVSRKNLRVHNNYFEEVPWTEGASVVLETRTCTPPAIRSLLRNAEIASAFRS